MKFLTINISEWRNTGGCYWICAEEILRHILLNSIDETISDQLSTSRKELCIRLREVIDDEIKKHAYIAVPDSVLSIKIPKLQQEFHKLIDQIETAEDAQVKIHLHLHSSTELFYRCCVIAYVIESILGILIADTSGSFCDMVY